MFRSKRLWTIVVLFSFCFAGLVLAQSGLSTHTIWGVTITGEDLTDYTDEIPRDWINPNADHAAFTIDLTSDIYQVESCLYEMGYILVRQRIRYRAKITDNSTGTVIGQQDFYGSSPEACPYTYYFGSFSDFVTGAPPDKPEDFQKWLNGFKRRLTPATPTAVPESTAIPLADGAVFGAWLKFDHFTADEQQLYTSVFPPEWLARSEAEAAYTISLSLGKQNVGKCYFPNETPSQLPLQRRQLSIEIRSASDKRIGATTLYGASVPCPDSIPIGGLTLGDPPHAAQFIHWLNGFARTLTPPTATPTPTLSPTPTLAPTATMTPSPTLSPTPLVVPADAPEVTVASKTANLRAQPVTSAAIVGVAQSGQALKVIGRNSAGDWLQIVTPDGKAAWVFASLLDLKDVDVTKLPLAQS